MSSKKYKGEKAQNVFSLINYAEITLQAYIMKYMFRFKHISTNGRDTSFTKLWENDADSCNSKQITDRPREKYEQQCLFTERNNKTTANDLNFDFLCVFFLLVNSTARTRILF